MNKFSETDLEQLYGIACEQGWDALEQSERIAVGRWCTRTGRERPGVAPTRAPEPSKPVEGGESYFEALGLGKDERTEDDLRLLRQVRLLDEFPKDILTGRRVTKYEDAAEALKRFGKPGVVASGLSRNHAVELRRTIRCAKTSTWRPAGAYRAEVAPDHEREGCYRVIAQYLGGPDGR